MMTQRLILEDATKWKTTAQIGEYRNKWKVPMFRISGEGVTLAHETMMKHKDIMPYATFAN